MQERDHDRQHSLKLHIRQVNITPKYPYHKKLQNFVYLFVLWWVYVILGLVDNILKVGNNWSMGRCPISKMIFVDLHVIFRSRSLYAIAVPSVCLSTVTFVHPTQPVEIVGNFFCRLVPCHPLTSTEIFTEIVPGDWGEQICREV